MLRQRLITIVFNMVPATVFLRGTRSFRLLRRSDFYDSSILRNRIFLNESTDENGIVAIETFQSSILQQYTRFGILCVAKEIFVSVIDIFLEMYTMRKRIAIINSYIKMLKKYKRIC